MTTPTTLQEALDQIDALNVSLAAAANDATNAQFTIDGLNARIAQYQSTVSNTILPYGHEVGIIAANAAAGGNVVAGVMVPATAGDIALAYTTACAAVIAALVVPE